MKEDRMGGHVEHKWETLYVARLREIRNAYTVWF
jgi:hypothetical protein